MTTASELLQALSSALDKLRFLERARTNYHIVVISDDNSVRVEHYETQDALVDALRVFMLQDAPPQVIPFIGAPMPITRPPNRQLRTPDGLIPLHVPEQPLDEDDFSWSLSDEAPEIISPVPTAPAAADNVDIDEDLEDLDDLDDDA